MHQRPILGSSQAKPLRDLAITFIDVHKYAGNKSGDFQLDLRYLRRFHVILRQTVDHSTVELIKVSLSIVGLSSGYGRIFPATRGFKETRFPVWRYLAHNRPEQRAGTN